MAKFLFGWFVRRTVQETTKHDRRQAGGGDRNATKREAGRTVSDNMQLLHPGHLLA